MQTNLIIEGLEFSVNLETREVISLSQPIDHTVDCQPTEGGYSFPVGAVLFFEDHFIHNQAFTLIVHSRNNEDQWEVELPTLKSVQDAEKRAYRYEQRKKTEPRVCRTVVQKMLLEQQKYALVRFRMNTPVFKESINSIAHYVFECQGANQIEFNFEFYQMASKRSETYYKAEYRPVFDWMGHNSGLQKTGYKPVHENIIRNTGKPFKTPICELMEGHAVLTKEQKNCIFAGINFTFNGVEIPCENVEVKQELIRKYPEVLLNRATEIATEIHNGEEVVLYQVNDFGFETEVSSEFIDIGNTLQVETSIQPCKMVRVVCPSTGRIYYHFVPNEIQSPLEAVAWMFGLTRETYSPISES